LESILSKLVGFLDITAKIVGGIAALIAIAALLLPKFIWNPFEAKISSLYGINGWVYYEIGIDRKLTEDGGLYLLKNSEKALYEDIVVGDKLRVGHDVNLRQGPTKEFPVFLALERGVCVIVTNPPSHAQKGLKDAISGGRLKVTTTSCGIFR